MDNYPERLKSMRKHVEEYYSFIVPDEIVLTDSPDYFSYKAGDTVVGWHRNTEIFWRNRKDAKED